MTKRVVARLSFLTLGVVCLSLYMDSIPIKELKGYTPYALYLQAKNEQCPFNAQAKNFSPLPNRHFIAHAGGAIIENGKPFTYTNSKEALLQSIAEGFSFIELDLMLDSSGGYLVRMTMSISLALQVGVCLKTLLQAKSRFYQVRSIITSPHLSQNLLQKFS